MKKIIRLTESDLHRIVKNTVNRVLREAEDYDTNKAYEKYFNGEDAYDLDDDWKQRYDKIGNETYPDDILYMDDDQKYDIGNEGEEWLNTPEKNRNEKFPTIWPKKRRPVGQTDFNDLKDGSKRIRDYKYYSQMPYTVDHIKKWARQHGYNYDPKIAEKLGTIPRYGHFNPEKKYYWELRNKYEKEFGIEDGTEHDDYDMFGLYPTKRKMEDDEAKLN